MSWSAGKSLFHANGPGNEKACSPSDILAAGIRWSLLSGVLVDSSSLNQVDKVYRTLSSMDGMHHGELLGLYEVVNPKPVEVSKGGCRVIQNLL